MYIGLIAMFGWFSDVSILTSYVADAPTIKFTAAFSLVVAGLLLFSSISVVEGNSELGGITVVILAIVLMFFNGMFLFEVLTGLRTGFGDLFVIESPGSLHTVQPGQPSVAAIAAFMLVAFIGFCMQAWPHRVKLFLSVLGAVLVVISGIALLGYAFNVPALFFAVSGLSTALSLPAAVGLLLLGIGFFMLGRRARTQVRAAEQLIH